ncbi:hypothetical protein Fmac_005965 [Flemingia macrophylla]|uniref:Uncharacterized protein n=1 Tax=Flemingia macrophylla TaxID=520843 RepID=A0ABD1N9E2_9FABA
MLIIPRFRKHKQYANKAHNGSNKIHPRTVTYNSWVAIPAESGNSCSVQTFGLEILVITLSGGFRQWSGGSKGLYHDWSYITHSLWIIHSCPRALYQNCVDEKPYAIKWSTAPDSRYFLQRVIRQEFSECTVINVAHRVPTVIGSDMVMVLSYSKLVEYDEPSKLMEDQSSSFSKLVVEYWSSCSRISL